MAVKKTAFKDKHLNRPQFISCQFPS